MTNATKRLLATKSKFIFITGPAGSGKTYVAREAINCKPKWGLLAATTGVAARVLGTNVHGEVKTVNSTVGFFDIDSRPVQGGLLRKETEI